MAQVTIIPQEGADSKVSIDKNLAMESVTLKNMIEDVVDVEAIIPLPGTPQEALIVTFEYVKKVLENPVAPKAAGTESEIPVRNTELDEWKKEYFAGLVAKDMGLLFYFILAANYLDIKYALDDACKYIASLIKGKNPEEIRKTFMIPPGFRIPGAQ